MDRAAREELILSNQALVLFIARKYHVPGLPLKDLVQEGNIGLIKAAETFDPSKGKFGTHAFWWVKAHILRAVEKSCLVHVPSCPRDQNRGKKEDASPCQIVELKESATVWPDEDDGPFDAANKNETKQAVQRMVSGLTPREKRVVCLRFGLGNGAKDHTIEEIARTVGLTPERVRQILNRALKKMRRTKALKMSI